MTLRSQSSQFHPVPSLASGSLRPGPARQLTPVYVGPAVAEEFKRIVRDSEITK